MCTMFTKRSKMLTEIIMKPFHHRAFYCYLVMSLWIIFLITAMYTYMSANERVATVKKVTQRRYLSKNDIKFRRLFLKSCNPPDNIRQGSEAAVDHETWMLQGALVVTRHGDRGPLTHLKGGDKLPCDIFPPSPLLASYTSFVYNVSGGMSRGPWASPPGPFHNFPSLPPRAAALPTRCALGQLTNIGLLQMLRVGEILKNSYAELLGLDNAETTTKRDKVDVVTYSTRYRRTYQSMLGSLWGLSAAAMGRRAAAARESHTVTFCFGECACAAQHLLNKKLNVQAKRRLDNHPTIKDLVKRISKVIFESQENANPETVRDALLAYMCHEAPLPCSQRTTNSNDKTTTDKKRIKRSPDNSMVSRKLLDVDIDTLNMELDYINNNHLDFNNEVGRKARDIIGKYYDTKQKAPLDFDAQMEREKLLYYQQRYLDTQDGYEDVVVVKKNLDADFNFPNEARAEEFDEDNYKEPTQDSIDDYCIKNEHVISIFAYIDWVYKMEMKNIHNRRRGLLNAYGLIHNIVQNMIRMISENKPKFVLYSGHDKTIYPLILALGLKDYYDSVPYASRFIFEVYRKKDLRDEFKFTKRKAVAQDFFFRAVYNGDDVTNKLEFCKKKYLVMNVVDPIDDMKIYNTFLCPIESIVRFIHDDYFALFNVTNYKDACATYVRS